jgi:hypothetical protein
LGGVPLSVRSSVAAIIVTHLGCSKELEDQWSLPVRPPVLVQPSPDGGVTEGGRQPAGADMGAKFGHAPARKRRADPTGQFAGDGFNVHDQFWGGKPGVGRGVPSLPDRPVVF